MATEQNSRQLLGALLIILGGVFLVDNLDLISFEISQYIFRWEIILILIGTIILINNPKKSSGLVFIAIGSFFLLRDLNLLENDDLRTWWPVILVSIGVFVILSPQKVDAKRVSDKRDQERI